MNEGKCWIRGVIIYPTKVNIYTEYFLVVHFLIRPGLSLTSMR